MQGQPEVIECLIELLRGELSARDQYFIHSRQYEDQGLLRLFERIGHEMEEETQHADAILRRILFLGGRPDMRPHEFTPGETVEEMLRKDLATEYPPSMAWYMARRKDSSSTATLEAPPPGRMPQLISDRPNLASSEAKARSQANSGP